MTQIALMRITSADGISWWVEGHDLAEATQSLGPGFPVAFYLAYPSHPLCHDEGCPHYGVPHFCFPAEKTAVT